MSNSMNSMEALRMILVIALVVLLYLFSPLIVGAAAFAVLIYLVWQGRRRTKILEARIAQLTAQPSETPDKAQTSAPTTPTSTDA